MNVTKFTIAALIAGIIYFFLGWLVYGILLEGVMTLPDGMKEIIEYKPEEMKMGMIVLSCLVWGILLAYLLEKMGISDWKSGAVTCAIVALIISLSMGSGQVAMWKFATMNNVLIDMCANAFCSAIAGAAAAWYLGRK